MIRKVVVVFLALFVIFGSFFLMKVLSGSKKPPQKRKAVESKKYVKTSPIAYSEISTQIEVFGRVASALPLSIISESSGKIRQGSASLKEGARFKKGDLLFKIDSREAELNLKSQKSSFLRDIAGVLADFKIDFPESFSTWQNYFNSIDIDSPLPKMPDVLSEKEKVYLATKNIFASYYNILSREENLSKYKVYAPFNGSIISVNMQLGAFANPGAKVLDIIKSNALELKAPMSVDDVAWLKKGSGVTVSNETQTLKWEGKISRIASTVNPNTQSIDVFIDIKPNTNPIFEGMYLKAEIPGNTIAKGMRIPRSSVFNNKYVYIVEDSSLKSKEINILKVDDESLVFEGVDEGLNLVIEPLINAYDNMRVFKLEEEQNQNVSISK